MFRDWIAFIWSSKDNIIFLHQHQPNHHSFATPVLKTFLFTCSFLCQFLPAKLSFVSQIIPLSSIVFPSNGSPSRSSFKNKLLLAKKKLFLSWIKPIMRLFLFFFFLKTRVLILWLPQQDQGKCLGHVSLLAEFKHAQEVEHWPKKNK